MEAVRAVVPPDVGLTAAAPAPATPEAGEPPAPAPAEPPPAREPAPETQGEPDRHEPVLGPAEGSTEGGRVKLVLDDGTLATPELDEELTERLRYIVDNIVTPPEQPST